MTQAFSISPVNEADLAALEKLAREIWYQHYPGIIRVAQMEYMLAQRYSPDVVRAQIAHDEARWDKLEVNERLEGFVCYETGVRPDSMKLDKVYVHLRHRGKGYGSALIRRVEQVASEQALREIYLQVNKYNRASIAAYLRNGFSITESIQLDIGGGFIMDDYVMAKPIRLENVRRHA